MKKITLLLLFACFSLFTQAQDYAVSKIGSIIIATAQAGSGRASYSGNDAYTVIQSCVNSLQTGKGGWIQLSSGTYNLSDEITITGWTLNEPPDAQIKITGSGYATQFNQNTAGKNGIVVKNHASIVLRDFYVYTGSSAKSGILLDKSGANSEVSVFGGDIENVFLSSNSNNAPAFDGINFFDLNVSHLTALNDSNYGVVLESNSASVNYGNSHFSFLRAMGSNTAPYAALKVFSSANAYRYIDNMTFDNVQAIAGYYGIYLFGANGNSFNYVDVEYIKYPIYVDGSGNNESLANRFLSGYILPQGTGAVGITAVAAEGGNSFSMKIDGSNTIIPISDSQQYRAPNTYDIVYGYSVNPASCANVSPNTIWQFRSSATGLTTKHP